MACGALGLLAGAGWFFAAVDDAETLENAPESPVAVHPSGFVVDGETLTRIPGVLVIARDADGHVIHETESNASGEFSLPGKQVPTALLARKEGYATAEGPWGGEIKMYQTAEAKISARAYGSLLQSTTLLLRVEGEAGSGEPRTLELVLDGGGKASFSVTPGTLTIAAQAKDNAKLSGSVVAQITGGSQRDLVLDLTPRGALRVVVQDEDGGVIQGARVETLHRGSEGVGTGEDGAALLKSIPAGEVRLRISAHEFSTLITDPVDIVEGREGEVTLTLPPLQSLVGRVLTPAGKPIGGGKVILRSVPFPGSSDSFSVFKGGIFRASKIEAGEYFVKATHPLYGPSDEVRIDTAQDKQIELHLGRGGGMEGSVVDASGDVVSGPFSVVVEKFEPRDKNLNNPGGRWVKPRIYTRSDGTFGATSMGPGVYTLFVDVPELGTARKEVEVDAGRITSGVRIQLDAGAMVTGRVVDAETGDPLAGAYISVRDHARYSRGLGSRSATTDEDGNFLLEGLSAGRRSVTVVMRGYVTKVVAGLELEDRDDEDREIELEPLKKGSKPKMEFFGVGASLKTAPGGELMITNVLDGGPASFSGLQKGDKILSVNGQSAQKLGIGKAIEMIRGEEGTEVSLQVIKVGEREPTTVDLERGRVVFERRPFH